MMKNSIYIIFLLIFSSIYGQENQVKFLVGTYTNTCKSEGVYVYDLDLISGNVSMYNHSDKVENPSYLSVSTDSKAIYSVNESGDKSEVSAFKYNNESGAVSLINKQKAEGSDPCYLINDDKNVLIANYSSGSISVFKKTKAGGINPAAQIIEHKGRSKNNERQASSHVHQVQFSPDGKYVLASDLGTDKIYIYNYDKNSDNEILSIKDSVQVRRGGGPRHLTFSPNGKFAYLLQELDGVVIAFSYHDGILRKLEETQVVDDDFRGEIGAAAIKLSPDGKFLYATNRGVANDITVFVVHADGRLNYKASYPSGGKGPRDFAIDPSGSYLLVANQNSNEITVFKRDNVSGKLTLTNKTIAICSPSSILFVP